MQRVPIGCGLANETTQSYSEQTFGGIPLAVGQGYVARMGSTGAVTFSGSSFNTGTQSEPGLTRTGTTEVNRGYNLVGNPYPSTVSWDDASKTNLETTLWYRTHNGSTMLYDTYNASGSLGTNNNLSGAVTGAIPPTQAFWVRVSADELTGALSFDNADRSHGSLAGVYKTEQEEGNIRMVLTNGTVSDEQIIAFNPSAQDGFDEYDSQKFWASNIPQLYTHIGEDTLTINGLNSPTSTPTVALGMKAPAQGEYTLNATSITFTETGVYLEDTQLGIFQDLNAAPTYSFTSEAGNIASRFVLHFSNTITGLNGWENNINVFATNNAIQVNLTKAETGTVTVLDMSGRMVYTQPINSNRTTMHLNVTSGIYMVQVNLSEKSITRKVSIQ